MRILLLTAGSRGEVDPFLALADRTSAAAPPVPARHLDRPRVEAALGGPPGGHCGSGRGRRMAPDDGCGAGLDVVERICDR